MKPEALAIVGPTAVGKSAYAMRLAADLGGEIVNADALQVYRGFDIGTAKPTPEERARIPHHLIDILDPPERYSAGEFARRAAAAVSAIRGRGRIPILVGGSGLYLRALRCGLATMPPVSRGLRATLRSRLAAEGLPALYSELADRDPTTAARLAPGDTQRILRALEIVLGTGEPQSAWLRREPTGPTVSLQVIGLTLDRALLYDRIALRVGSMLDRGWLAEVEQLLASGTEPTVPAFQAIGYRQILGFLEGDFSLDQAAESIILATRRYAKRQQTWFKSETAIRWLTPAEIESGARGDPFLIHS